MRDTVSLLLYTISRVAFSGFFEGPSRGVCEYKKYRNYSSILHWGLLEPVN